MSSENANRTILMNEYIKMRAEGARVLIVKGRFHYPGGALPLDKKVQNPSPSRPRGELSSSAPSVNRASKANERKSLSASSIPREVQLWLQSDYCARGGFEGHLSHFRPLAPEKEVYPGES